MKTEKKRRVVITGLGTVNPTGNTVAESWAAIKDGRCAVEPITAFDTADFKVKLAAEVKNFDPAERIDKREARKMARFTQFAVAAAEEAIGDSGLALEEIDRTRFGVILSSGIGGLPTIEEEHTRGQQRGFEKVSPYFVPMSIGNMAAGQIAIRFGLQGMCSCPTTACAGGTNAIGDAFHRIRDGYEASRFGLMVTDENDKISEFQEKPKNPKSNLASMGIYIFNWDVLKKYLTEDEADPNSENDFGKNVIPNLLKDGRRMYAYHFSGYWKDVGTISSLWQANMEVLDPSHSGINLFDENWKIYSRNSGKPCQQIGSDATIVNSMISEGCKVNGTVNNSILFPGVVVEKGATVEAAVVMGGTVIKAGASVKHCIVAENVKVEEGATVGAMPEGSLNIEEPGDVATVGSGVVIGKGATVGPKAMVSSDVKDGEEQW